MKTKLPTIADVSALLRSLKSGISDDYRALGCEDETVPSMQVTIGADGTSTSYGWQTGDNSYTGGAYSYPFWGVVTLQRRSNCRALAADAINQIRDQLEA